MINIQPYLDKLDRLKEYMDGYIDSGNGIWINIEALSPDFTLEEIIDIWDKTGCIMYSRHVDENCEPPRKITFEEYLQLNN